MTLVRNDLAAEQEQRRKAQSEAESAKERANRVGIEIRREWMAKCERAEAACIEKDRAINGFLTFYGMDEQPGEVSASVHRQGRRALSADAGNDYLERLRRLAVFAAQVMEGWPEGGCEFDGGELQEMATRAGLLEAKEMAEPCGEDCACAQFLGEDEFPLTCYRTTDLLKLGRVARDRQRRTRLHGND